MPFQSATASIIKNGFNPRQLKRSAKFKSSTSLGALALTADGLQLPLHHSHRFVGFAFFGRLTEARNHLQTCTDVLFYKQLDSASCLQEYEQVSVMSPLTGFLRCSHFRRHDLPRENENYEKTPRTCERTSSVSPKTFRRSE